MNEPLSPADAKLLEKILNHDFRREQRWGRIFLMLSPLYYAGGFWGGYFVGDLILGFTLGSLTCLLMAIIGTAQLSKAKFYQLIQHINRSSDSS